LDRRGRLRDLSPRRVARRRALGPDHGGRPAARHPPDRACEARRIEAGIFNYGSDITIENNPFEVSGLERLVEAQEADYIGKAALERIRVEGVSRKLVGLEFEGDALPFEIAEKRPALVDGNVVGTVTDLIWSPRLEKNIGYVWLPIELAGPGTELVIEGPDGSRVDARSAAIPFIDPRKKVPLG
jgi:glycine cleavage system aminomethyltransferase T